MNISYQFDCLVGWGIVTVVVAEVIFDQSTTLLDQVLNNKTSSINNFNIHLKTKKKLFVAFIFKRF